MACAFEAPIRLHSPGASFFSRASHVGLPGESGGESSTNPRHCPSPAALCRATQLLACVQQDSSKGVCSLREQPSPSRRLRRACCRRWPRQRCRRSALHRAWSRAGGPQVSCGKFVSTCPFNLRVLHSHRGDRRPGWIAGLHLQKTVLLQHTRGVCVTQSGRSHLCKCLDDCKCRCASEHAGARVFSRVQSACTAVRHAHTLLLPW